MTTNAVQLLGRGSEWHRWDLHVHTPASELHNNFGQDWDSYVQGLMSQLIARDIRAVGITDYFSIEGYRQLTEEYLADDEKLKTCRVSA